MRRSRLITTFVLFTLSSAAAGAPAAIAGFCPDRFQQQYHQAESAYQPAEKRRLLAQVTEACPDHVEALNALGNLHENAGRLAEAEAAYSRAIRTNPEYPLPYAGLGDVLARQSRHQEAANLYKAFLRALNAPLSPEGRQRWNAAEQARWRGYAPPYRQKLQDALGLANLGSLVSLDQITRALGRQTYRSLGGAENRGLRLRAEIDIPIRFDTDSAAIRPDSRTQLREVIGALRSEGLNRDRFLIQGHTDGRGSDAYNLVLSQRRARSVREALIAAGIDGGRLETEGLGESDPLADNGAAEGRAANRRVTWVNLGPM